MLRVTHDSRHPIVHLQFPPTMELHEIDEHVAGLCPLFRQRGGFVCITQLDNVDVGRELADAVDELAADSASIGEALDVASDDRSSAADSKTEARASEQTS